MKKLLAISLALILALGMVSIAAAEDVITIGFAQLVTSLASTLTALVLGVVAHLQQFRQEGLAIAVALTVSTALAIAAGALVFKIVARWTGQDSEPGE